MFRRFSFDVLNHLAGRKRKFAALTLVVLALAGWAFMGVEVISYLNPTLSHELAIAQHPALDVWISPPEYVANSTPMIISTPAGLRFEGDTLVVPKGSILSAHLAERDGDTPELMIDSESQYFAPDAHGDFSATAELTTGQKLSIRRGWITLASWKIRVLEDAPPQVTFVEPPSVTESKTVRLFYKASDEFRVTDVALRVTPHDPMPGADNTPVDIPLFASAEKQVARVDFQDLTTRPWAGQKVSLQIVATNESGKKGVSALSEFTLPERSFFHPLARVLVEERKKLLLHPEDRAVREEAANIMASISHQPNNYQGDPVILMALRSGAIRLILGNDSNAAVSVNDLLWQSAMRIEDGSKGAAQHVLQDARQDLAQAIERNAGKQEIDLLTARLQHALTDYLAHIEMSKTSDSATEIDKTVGSFH